MKSLLTLTALVLTSTSFATTVWTEKGKIQKTTHEQYISVDLEQDAGSYLFDYKIYTPSSIKDENGKIHGGEFKFSIVKNPGIEGKVCVRLTTVSATQSSISCTRGSIQTVTRRSETGEIIMERVVPEAVCTHSTIRDLRLRTASGKAKVLSSEVIETSEELNSENCVFMPTPIR